MRILAELDGSGSIVSRFIYATHINIPDLILKEGHLYRVITDHLGSLRRVVDVDSQEVVSSADYDEFGNTESAFGVGFVPFGFAGGLFDLDTRLTRFGARDYSSTTSRWMSRDPLLFGGGSANIASYANGDPVNSTDVSGLLVVPGDASGARALAGLGVSPEGRALIQYLDASPNVYTVFGDAPPPFDLPNAAGIAGNAPGESGHEGPRAYQGVGGANQSGGTCGYAPGGLDIRLFTPAGMSEVANLAHELGHAAMYETAVTGRGGYPDWIAPYLGSTVSGHPNGLETGAHYFYTGSVNDMFGGP